MTAHFEHWTDKLIDLNACREAVVWALDYPTLASAWRVCNRGDWMLWLIFKIEGEYTPELRLCVCDIWRQIALPHVQDPCLLDMIIVAERYARGEATEEELYAAESAAGYAAVFAAGSETWPKIADIVRKHFPELPNLDAI